MCLKPLPSCTDTRSVVFLCVKMCQVCLLAHCQPLETDGKLLFWKWTQPVLRCFSLIAVDYTLRIVATSFHETRLIFLYCYQYFHLSTYLPTYLGHDVSSRTLSVPWVCFAASQQDMLEDPHLGDLRKIFYWIFWYFTILLRCQLTMIWQGNVSSL